MFDFIKNKNLEEILYKSIYYIYYLDEQSKIIENESHKEETRRVTILYVISIIEAILFYFYKQCEVKIIKIEYTDICTLPKNYINNKKEKSSVVVAVQNIKERKDETIGLVELINFFKERGKIKDDTVKQIIEINNIRNTFHLNKVRDKVCDIKNVESAIALLIHTIKNAPNSLGI